VIARSPQPRWHRALRFVARASAALLLLIVALVIAVDLLADLPVVRRLVTRELNQVLEPTFKGRITLERLGMLGLSGVRAVDVRVQAPDGTTVIEAHGVRGRIAPLAILASFVRSRRLAIDVFDADVEALDVVLDTDDSGALKLATAFELAHPSPPTAEPQKGTLRLVFPRLTGRHAHVHGQPKGAPTLDGDFDALIARVSVAPEGTTVDVDHVELTTRGMPHGTDARGTLQAHIVIPSGPGDVEAGGSFAGDVGGIPATAKAITRGDRLDAVLDVPEADAEKIRALAAQAPVYQPAAAHAEAHGRLTDLGVTAHAAIGSGRADVHGTVALAGRLAAALSVDVRDLDLRAFSPSGARSGASLHADVRADARADGLIGGDFQLDVLPGGHVAGQDVPGAAIQGTFAQKPGDAGFVLEASGAVFEPGAPIALRVVARTGAPAPVVDLVASSQIDRLEDVRRVGGLGPGSAHVRIAGVLTLASPPSFDAAVDVDAVGLAHGSIHFDRAKLAARGYGPLSAPVVRGTLDLSRGDTVVHASVDQIRESVSGLAIVGLAVTGLGQPMHAALELQPGEVSFQGYSSGIALKPLGVILGAKDTLRDGRVAFAVDITGQRDGARGSLMLDVDDLCVGGVEGLEGHLAVSIDGRKVTGTMRATAQGVGRLNVTKLDLEVGGKGPLDRASPWRRTWGELDLEGEADLAKVLDLLPPNTLPFAKVSGQLALQGHVKRDRGSGVTPDVALALQTSQLVVAPKRAPDRPGPPLLAHPRGWQTAGVDVQVDAKANGATGFTTLGVRLVDKLGLLASLETSSAAIPYASIFASTAGAAGRMLGVPFSAEITVPSREIARLPDVLRPEGASGRVDGNITVRGTCLEPQIDGRVNARSVTFESSPDAVPLDGELTMRYDGERADVGIDARSRTDTLLRASAQLRARIADLIAGSAAAPPWVASASATLTHLPIDAAGPLADRRLHGTLSGQVQVTGVHQDARASADLDVEGLRVGKVTYGDGKVVIGFDGHTLDGRARFGQKGGFASAHASLGVLWGSRPAPAVDPSGSLEASLRARHFRAAFLAPFLQAWMDEIDGIIDGDADISSPAGKSPTMKGSISFTDGVVEPVALGQEFHSVNAKVTLTPDGVVRLESASADGTSGRLTASGVAHLQGSSIVAAEGVLKIAKKEAVPLAVQGAAVGTLYGQIGVKVTTSDAGRATTVDVDVPSLHVQLPEASPHSVQDLDPPPSDIHVGVYVSRGRFLVLPLDGSAIADAAGGDRPAPASPLTIAVHLGQGVEVRRGTDLRVMLGGELRAKLEQKVQVTGQIRLTGGKLDVQGKSFEIQTGTVTFVGDPSNPMIKVTAGWTAEDGTRVLADYTGPLKTGKVTLRSDPPRPQNEIVALILFGTADGSQSTPYATAQPAAATRAGTAVGGLATEGLSKGLDRLTGMDVTAKIDTSQVNPRPEVQVQVAKDISLQLAFVLGTPPPGTNPDTTYATIDWRFLRSWSLETTFGNLGSSIANVVWQHRY